MHFCLTGTESMGHWVANWASPLNWLTCKPHTSYTRAVLICHKTINLGHEITCNMWKITLWHHTDIAYAIKCTYETFVDVLYAHKHCACGYCYRSGPCVKLYAVCEGVVGGRTGMQYHLLVMCKLDTEVLSSWCCQHPMTPILTSLTLSNLSKPKPSVNDTCSSLTLPHDVLHSHSN